MKNTPFTEILDSFGRFVSTDRRGGCVVSLSVLRQSGRVVHQHMRIPAVQLGKRALGFRRGRFLAVYGWLQVVSVQPQGRFNVDSAPALANASAGLGMVWLPDCVTSDYLSLGALVPVAVFSWRGRPIQRFRVSRR